MISKPAKEGEDDDKPKKPRYSRNDAKDVPVASVEEISDEIYNNLKCENKKRTADSGIFISQQRGGCLRQHFLDDDESLDVKVIQQCIVRIVVLAVAIIILLLYLPVSPRKCPSTSSSSVKFAG